jgi:hypothetical protein
MGSKHRGSPHDDAAWKRRIRRETTAQRRDDSDRVEPDLVPRRRQIKRARRAELELGEIAPPAELHRMATEERVRSEVLPQEPVLAGTPAPGSTRKGLIAKIYRWAFGGCRGG